MKTLFLNPPSFSRFDSAGARFAATRKTRSLWYPAWLGYAAALVPNSKLIDAPAQELSIQKLLSKINRYDLVVIYTSTQSLVNDIKVAEAIKKKNQETKIIFVGPHVSVLPNEVLEASEAIDAVARGEFEETILEITEGKIWSKIKGLTFKKSLPAGRQGKKIVHNPQRPILMSVEKIPFLSPIYKRDLPIRSYHLPFALFPYIAIYSGRGCPNRCIFCLWPQTFTGRIYRKRSVNNVIEEVKWIKKNMPEIKEIFFDDDTFTVNKNWVRDFCEKVKPLKVIWSINARADLDYELMKQMKDSGCRVLVVGYESGDSNMLKRMKKGVTIPQLRRFTKDANKAKLMIHGTFLLGLPGETLKTIEKTKQFACDLDLDTIQVTIATPLPGTEFYEYCKKNNLMTSSSLIDRAGYQAPSISYPNLKAEIILKEVEKMHLKFYFRPSYILKTAKRFLTDKNEAKRITISSFEYAKYLLKLQK